MPQRGPNKVSERGKRMEEMKGGRRRVGGKGRQGAREGGREGKKRREGGTERKAECKGGQRGSAWTETCV